jgi:prevent-host-death family protein
VDNYRVVPVSEARQSLAPLIAQVRTERAPVYLTRRGRRIAAITDADDLDRLLRLDAGPGGSPAATPTGA